MNNAINWFEIPSHDFDRAVTFYSQVLGEVLNRGEFGGMPYAFFAMEPTSVGGAVVKNPDLEPGALGPVVYLNTKTSANLGEAVGRVAEAGGTIIMPLTSIGPEGFIAMMIDTEGNRVGLHAPAGS